MQVTTQNMVWDWAMLVYQLARPFLLVPMSVFRLRLDMELMVGLVRPFLLTQDVA